MIYQKSHNISLVNGFFSHYSMTFPQPNYSAFREASFGYAMFEIKNRTHAYYEWHRNQDSVAVVADSMVFYNRYWYPIHES